MAGSTHNNTKQAMEMVKEMTHVREACKYLMNQNAMTGTDTANGF